MVIDRWYEDDGVSGYIFDRPGFRQMMADLDKDIDTVYVKDLGFKKTKQSILPYINLMKELGILEDTDNPLKPYNIVKTKKEIMILMHQYLPDLPAQMTSKQLSDNYLHYYGGNRRYAGNGI